MFLNIDRQAPERIALVDSDNDLIRYGEIIEEALKLGKHAKKRALVFVLSTNTVGGALGFLNCLINRMVPLMISSNIDKSLLNELINIYRPSYLWEPESMKSDKDMPLYSSHGYILISTGEEPYPMNDELALLLTTSGSTGSPKLVRHSYSNIDSQAKNISGFFQVDSTERPLLDLPIYYTMGLSVLYSHLFVGATIFITPLSVLDVSYWSFVKKSKVTSITNIPYTFELLYKIRFFKMELPELRIITQGGGKLKPDIYSAFAEFAVETGRKFIPTYGQTEGTARMAYVPPEYAIKKIVSIGRAIPEGNLYIIDEDGNQIAEPNMVGELVYEGPNVTLGYAECSEDLLLGDERHGILYTGDLAKRDEDGFFYIVGRKSRFLKICGHRVGLDECETLIKSEFENECACTGSDKRLIIYVTEEKIIENVKKYISEITHLNSSLFEVRYIEKIPRNEAGKIWYSKLQND